ncbi:hydantoinase B/oxoprolinase family protein [Bradyrhizobium mercantei]|uniref:hydantoinase B/oxoprolinase family protein n=1 Tax=Bradyrhizobium mercantei TaxID=1904807 RepID=UPI000B5AC046|nr:hydantoinase B/oxoprolinase family protein [Bradyrhizobium mercantei]
MNDVAGTVEHDEVDMFTMVVLRRRIEAVIRNMINTLFRTGRSGVLNTAMDFSCSVTDSEFRTVSTALGLPVHVGAIDLIPKAIAKKFGDDQHPGDCFANNSAYHGNTHCGDFTLCAPVFLDGEVIFYAIARAHLGDIGFPTPTTYGPLSRDIYEEGLKLPCVRIQRNYVDVQEVIDICQANIRAPNQFYGDYLATLAAVRTGEIGMQQICRQYGVARVRKFLAQFQEYAKTMAIAAIRKLPAGRVTREARYDSETDLYPEGIPIRVTIDVDPEEGMITVDLMNNVDNLPLGINLSEATMRATCYTAVLTVLGPDVPRSTGAYNRIRILSREGAAIGRPKFPAATSCATTNLTQLLGPMVRSAFADLRKGLGSACGTLGMPASCAVVSGQDDRRNGERFINQIIMGFWGGPGLQGHDGWFTHGGSGSMGALWQSSIEIVEQQQPVLVEALEIIEDSGGAGEWCGAPGAYCIFRSRTDGIRYTGNAAGHDFPPFGVAGGLDGSQNDVLWEGRDGARHTLANSFDIILNKDEKLVSKGSGGGGYGNPLDRNPDLVARDVQEGWVSPARARQTFGVVLQCDGFKYHADHAATGRLRADISARVPVPLKAYV